MRFWKWDITWLVILFCAFGYFINIYLTSGIYDLSDGLAHFAISRYAPKHPELFLDHWGKPLFTLLSSPFAQFGIKGVMIFNVLLYVICARFLVLLFSRLSIPAGWLSPLIIALSPVWFQVTMGGLTEPLFATLLVAGLYFFANEKYTAAAFIVGWLPFARSEAIFILPLFGLAFIVLRQWVSLLLLASASIFMSLLGWFLLNDILWMIHNVPYVGAKDIYGSGSFFHFWDDLFLVTGTQIKYLSVVGLLAFLIKGWQEPKRITFLLAFGSLILVFFGHSWFWYKGIFGSYGLLRVLATVLPLFVLFAFYGVSRISNKLPAPVVSGIMLAVALHLHVVLFYFMPIAKQADPQEKLIQELAAWRESSVHKNNQNIWYMHPAVGYYLGIDNFAPFDSRQFWYLNRIKPSIHIRQGGLLIYDGKHAPNEGNISKENLLADPDLVLIKRVIPKNEIVELNGYPFELLVFEKQLNLEKDTLVFEDFTKPRPLLSGRLERLATDSTGKPYFDMVGWSHYVPVFTFWKSDNLDWANEDFTIWYEAERPLDVWLSIYYRDGHNEDVPWHAGNFRLPDMQQEVVYTSIFFRNKNPDEPLKLYRFGLQKTRD